VELHRRIGLWRQVQGKVPAWFNEGLAVIVSDDPRYLKPGVEGVARCVAGPPEVKLPASPFEWSSSAGHTPGLYAQAACRVLQWMEANGGNAGLLAAIAQVGEGKRSLP
jgi:hypothetical protein